MMLSTLTSSLPPKVSLPVILVGPKSAILIESDQNLNIELKEKGFYSFKKKLLKKKGMPIVTINELGWEDYSYQ